MNRKAFRCSVLALLLTAAVALPAAARAHGSPSTRPAGEHGWWATAGDLALRALGWGGFPDRFLDLWGLAHLSRANRGGIDPNGAPPLPTDPTTTTSTDPGDNRGGIDPNG
jgi:hypothetical protein